VKPGRLIVQAAAIGLAVVGLLKVYDEKVEPWLKRRGKVVSTGTIGLPPQRPEPPKVLEPREEDLPIKPTEGKPPPERTTRNSNPEPPKELTPEEIEEILRNLRSIEGGSPKSENIIDKIKKYAALEGVDPKLCIAVAKVESNFDPEAVSSKGAVGVFQILPSLAARYGYRPEDLFDPDLNIRLGVRHLKELLRRFRDVSLALAAYHAGVGRVIRSGYRVPRIRKTMEYVRKVKEVMEEYEEPG